jgi:RNA polymerase sigma-70 factor (ECF subfamily)
MPHELSTGQMAFRTTHWTVVRAAQQGDDGISARQAMATLCSTYWPPLYAFIRRGGHAPHDAEDLTQEFFYYFLEGDRLRDVAPAKGKFRSFLLACLKQFLAKEHARAQTAKRGGGRKLISLDTPEAQYSSEPVDHLTPEALFDQRWAATVLTCTLEDLRQEYALHHKTTLFEDLMGFLPGCEGSASRAELAARHQVSVGAIDVAIHRLRQRFGALLRQRVAQTVSAADEVDEELDYLMVVIGNSS